MMNGAINRVARAIVESTSGPFEMLSKAGQAAALVEARAAIAAMREPTEAMIEAAGSEHAAVPPREAWQAMIDEALRT